MSLSSLVRKIPVIGGTIDDIGSAAGDAARDYSRVGRSNFNPNVPVIGPSAYDPNRDRRLANSGLGASNAGGAYAGGEMQRDRGAMAQENQVLADREAAARFGNQNQAIDLQRQAAMGLAPSAAQIQSMRAMDDAVSSQAAMAGSARGQGAIALAQGNAAGNVARMQNQSVADLGQLRANEMAAARAGYGDLATQQRGQDLNRLQLGNQMSLENARLNDSYRLGMGQLGLGYGELSRGWTGDMAGADRYAAEMEMKRQMENAKYQMEGEGLRAGIDIRNHDLEREMRDKWTNMGVSMGNTAGQGLSSLIPSGGPKPGGGIGGSAPGGK